MTPPRRAAGAGLFPGDAAGTLSCLVGESSASRLLSPVWGLATAACPALLHNLATCAAPNFATKHIGAAHLLARELFVLNGFGSRPSNSQSKAHRNLSPKLLGQLSAMALRHAASSELVAALAANGVTTNKVNNVWTGVSMARYVKLYDLLVAAAFPSSILRCDAAPPGWAVWQRYVWERMASRSDLLLYFDGVAEAAGRSGIVFDRNAFTSSAVCLPIDDPAEFEAVVERAIAAGNCAVSMERLLCELGRTTCAHCAIKIRKFAPSGAREGTPPKSDCVELCVREFFLFWQQCNLSVPVPDGTVAHALLQTEWDTAKSGDPAQRWFDALQGLAGCNYLSECSNSSSSNGRLRYELAPSVANMGAAVATLLGLDAQQVAPSAEGCVALMRSFGFDCDSTVRIFRAPGTEESRLKETLTVRAAAQNSAPRWIEVSFELPHPTAKVAHRLSGPSHDWRIVAAAIKKRQQTHEASAPLWLLRAAVDPDGPLDNEEWRQQSGRDAVDAAALAVMTSRRKIGCDEWRPTEAATFYSEDTTIRELRLAEKRSAKALQAVRSVVEPGDASASALVPWLAMDVPERPPSLLQRLRIAMGLR